MRKVEEFYYDVKIKNNKDMNKINALFAADKGRKLFSLYFCAGCPTLESTAEVITTLDGRGVDMVEVGIPFSDPLADGPVIQAAATTALRNGMTLKKLFSQLAGIKDKVNIPLVLMGYLNVIMHYGYEEFFKSCAECGVSGTIIPDLPFDDYLTEIKPVADRYDIRVIMMITPETDDERIRLIDNNTESFIYMVSCAGTTGARDSFDGSATEYFRHVESLGLKNPCMTGFGISNRQTLDSARQYSAGAIIGSRFVTLLNECGDAEKAADALYQTLGL